MVVTLIRLTLIGVWFFTASCVCFLADFAQAQVIQLPTTRNFSFSGGALVPDSGTAHLGGVGYGSQSSLSRGGPLLSNRAVGMRGGATGVAVSAEIIDLDALDQAILNTHVQQTQLPVQASNKGSSTATDDADKARRFISGYRSVSGVDEPTDYRDFNRSLRSRPETKVVQESLAESNIRYYLKRGQEAENANRIQSARVYYRMALESMTPQLLERYHRVLAERQTAQESPANAGNSNRKPF